MKKIIFTPEAPAPIGPYSQAIEWNNTIFVSGQIAIDPKTGNLINENIELETHRVLDNIGAILNAAELSFQNVVKC